MILPPRLATLIEGALNLNKCLVSRTGADCKFDSAQLISGSA